MKYADIIICLMGVALLAYWLLKTSLGRRALVDSAPRRNNLPLYMPAVALFFWVLTGSLTTGIGKKLASSLPDRQSIIVDNIALCAGSILTAAFIVILARAHFARRLRGFGLNLKAFPKDLLKAPLYLLAVWPLIMAAIKLTVDLARYVSDPQYQMHQHQQLEVVASHPDTSLRALIFITAVVIVPVFEELMFRGLIQTTVRSFLQIKNGVWAAIAVSSGLFAIMHADPGHWPALFVLGTCMGYAYEKTGSLWRPIFIHSLFNATSVIATLSN